MARVTTSGFDAANRALLEMSRRVERSKNTALRAAAAATVAVAKSNAPVYQGDRTDVPRGRLKKAIKAGSVRKTAGLSEITVAATGVARAYAGQEEQRQPFMAPARDAAEAALTVAIEAELATALRGLF